MQTRDLTLTTGDRLVTDLTRAVLEFVGPLGDGLLTVFVPHATAGVAIMETASGSEPDLEDALERLLPTADVFRPASGARAAPAGATAAGSGRG